MKGLEALTLTTYVTRATFLSSSGPQFLHLYLETLQAVKSQLCLYCLLCCSSHLGPTQAGSQRSSDCLHSHPETKLGRVLSLLPCRSSEPLTPAATPP